MSKHTPTPWTEVITEDGEIWVVANPTHRYHVADMEGACSECSANARLIAAAPEMLEALEAVAALEYFSSLHDYSCGVRSGLTCQCARGLVHAAIAKAIGAA